MTEGHPLRGSFYVPEPRWLKYKSWDSKEDVKEVLLDEKEGGDHENDLKERGGMAGSMGTFRWRTSSGKAARTDNETFRGKFCKKMELCTHEEIF